ncbi:MAG: glucosaminidase domain-containing protein [Succinivibrio sp.]|nr:glucosaminidase domain-containing protein [Succinivibrio sp.]
MEARDISSLKTVDPADVGLVGDHRGLNRLRTLGSGDKKQQAQALKAAAEQFESLLTQFWVNGMRKTNDTLAPDSPLHSKYSSMFEDMLSEQQVGQMTKNRSGISKNSVTYLIAKQFSKSLGDAGKELLDELTSGGAPRPDTFTQGYGKTALPYLDPNSYEARFVNGLKEQFGALPEGDMKSFDSQEDFVSRMMPFALKAVEGQGFNPLVIVAQAALETGWGKHVPSGNNYFGIKADASWKGQKENLSSPEFEQGKFVNEVSSFRSYSNVLDSMKDYVDFIRSNPRYGDAAAKSFDPDTYFDQIAKAGYATDPDYAAKLKNISRQIAFMAYK